MPAFRSRLLRIAAVTFCLTGIGRADPLVDRLDSIERRLTRVESAIDLLDDPTPATQPATQPTAIRADTADALRAAIRQGAQWIQTTGVDLSTALDAKGALIELLPGGPSWKPAVTLSGNGALSNATIKTPPSSFNSSGGRTGFYKALAALGQNTALRNVTFAPDIGFCIHVQGGTLTMESVKATTFTEYFVYQEPNTSVHAKWCEVKGGSKAESVWRVTGANYTIEESVLDNSGGGKAVLRGDSPGVSGSVGGVVRRCRLIGQVGPNPLTEDDGGQMIGIDRWRFAEGWLYQLDGARKPETLELAGRLYRSGATAAEIVRALADRFIDGAQLAKVAKGKTRLSDNDIALTLAFRDKEVGRHSRFLIEDCEIVGNLRVNARMTGTIRHTIIRATGDNTPISGNSQATYPFPVDRILVGGEQKPAPDVTFDGVELQGGPALGIDPPAWPTLKFINGSTYAGKGVASASPFKVLNSTPIEVEGVARIRTDGGLTYRDVLGIEQSAWVGGYDGPKGIAVKPASWKDRWREIDEKKLRAYARALKAPVLVLDIEHWEVDPSVHGVDVARSWLQRMAGICRTIKTERPDVVVGCYDILPASEYWALANWAAWQRWKATGERNNTLPDEWWAAKESEYRTAYETWQKNNDFTAEIMLPAVDALFPSVYPSYRLELPAKADEKAIQGSLEMDRDVARLKVDEARRLSRGKDVYPFYWPIVTEDGGEAAGSGRTANTVKAVLDAGATGVVVWSDTRPKDFLERTIHVAKSTADSE